MSGSKQEIPHLNREKSEIVLASCLMDGDVSSISTALHSRREAFGLSLVIEILVLGLLMAAPLFRTIAQPQPRPMFPAQLTFFRSGPRPVIGDRVTTITSNRPSRIFDPFQPIAPRRATQIEATEDFPAGPISESEGAEPYIPGGDGMPGGVASPLLTENRLSAARPAQVEKRPVKMSDGVLEAQLINRVEPRYPTVAMQVKKEGTVVLHALISRDGRITSLEVVSGSPLLIGAALEAVQQWRYRPTMLNGEPVEVETTITVVFRLRN